MEQPQDLGAQAFWRADYANAALAVHNSASNDLRVRLSGAATSLRWMAIAILLCQALIVLSAWGAQADPDATGFMGALWAVMGPISQSMLVLISFVVMGFYVLRANDDATAHKAQTQTLEFVGKNLMARMRYEEWRDQIVSAASNDRSIFLARCTGIVREFCRNPGANADDFEAVKDALRAEGPEPHPTLDIMNALDFTGHPQLKTLIAGKRREFRDYVASIKRRMAESFADLERDGDFTKLAALSPDVSDKAAVNDARRRRFSRAMRHFAWLDSARDQIETGMPAYQLEGMKAFLIHDSFLENLSGHFSKARRLFAYANGAFLGAWGVLTIAHIAVIAARQPVW